jgi:hypothetical protein
MIRSGTAVEHQQGRLFPEEGAVGHEFRALDIKEKAYPVHGYVHGAPLHVDE